MRRIGKKWANGKQEGCQNLLNSMETLGLTNERHQWEPEGLCSHRINILREHFGLLEAYTECCRPFFFRVSC